MRAQKAILRVHTRKMERNNCKFFVLPRLTRAKRQFSRQTLVINASTGTQEIFLLFSQRTWLHQAECTHTSKTKANSAAKSLAENKTKRTVLALCQILLPPLTSTAVATADLQERPFRLLLLFLTLACYTLIMHFTCR